MILEKIFITGKTLINKVSRKPHPFTGEYPTELPD